MATISVHNGTTACRAHNLRLDSVLKTQPHIDKNGIHEIWHDESETAAYRRLFQNAVDEYNSKQTRDDRIIKNYHSKICQSGQQNTSYELIVGIYGSDCDPKTGYKILREYYDNWKSRNPRLEPIGVYYHADEAGDPHIHLDYVPVADGYTKGVSKQPGLRRALEQMGYGKNGKETAQIAWERAENEYLESLCIAHGLSVTHPGGRKKHLTVSEYKAEREEERQQKISMKTIDLHERKTIAAGRIMVDADGLEELKKRSHAYLMQQTEPSLKTRSAIATERSKALLKKESDLLERADALESEKVSFERMRQKMMKEYEEQKKTLRMMAVLLEAISTALHDLIDHFSFPRAVKNVLESIVAKIDSAIGRDGLPRESEHEL